MRTLIKDGHRSTSAKSKDKAALFELTSSSLNHQIQPKASASEETTSKKLANGDNNAENLKLNAPCRI